MKVDFLINSFEEERKRISESKKHKKWFSDNHYICVFPKISLEREYSINKYEINGIVNNWKKMEGRFFRRMKIIFNFQPKKNINVHFTRYGVGGSYSLPNKIIINVSKEYKKLVNHRTIAHEIIHLAVEEYMIKNKIDHWTKERIVSFIEKRAFSV